MLAVPRQEELYAMNRGHGDMEGIDSSFGWYLKYVRNHLRQFSTSELASRTGMFAR